MIGRRLRSEKQNPRSKPHQKREKSPKENTISISFKESDIVQRYLISSEGCPSCSQIHKDLKKEFKSGKIIDLDVGSEQGFEILTTLGIDGVPAFIVELDPDKFKGVKYILDE